MTAPPDGVRLVEALLFAASDPLSAEAIAERLPAGIDVAAALAAVAELYRDRGVQLFEFGGTFAFRTAEDLAPVLRESAVEQRKLSRAALETLAIVAYHQPVTRPEIEEIRGVGVNRGTLDVLMEAGWVRMRGRRRSPGRPVTYGTTGDFLHHFGLASLSDLPGLDELRGAGLLEGAVPAGFAIPLPSDDPALGADEDPLDADDEERYEPASDDEEAER
jgi:segregation and condensation protein B